MILLIDNYDSFTYNLYQYLGELGEEILVKRNDEVSVTQIDKYNSEAIIISPGPGRPENAGNCAAIIQQYYDKLPILGICLGHQAIGYSFGCVVNKAKNIMHGKVSTILHSEKNIFQNVPQSLPVMRYHSLVIQKETVPDCLEIIAKSVDDDEVMAIKHKYFPLYGMQFHPESIGTSFGKQLLKNFLAEIGKEVAI